MLMLVFYHCMFVAFTDSLFTSNSKVESTSSFGISIVKTFGSVSRKVSELADCPVLIAR